MAWGVFGEICPRISLKIVAQLRPRGGMGSVRLEQEQLMLALRWRLGAQLGDFGSIFDRFGVDLGAFWHMDRMAKIAKKKVLFNVFCYSGRFGWLVQASWALFFDDGSKSTFLRSFWGDVATCWRQGGDQERQDEPT